MFTAVLVSIRRELFDALGRLTAVEDADFLEDIHAIACAGPGRRPQRDVVASSHRIALQNDGKHRADREHDQKY